MKSVEPVDRRPILQSSTPTQNPGQVQVKCPGAGVSQYAFCLKLCLSNIDGTVIRLRIGQGVVGHRHAKHDFRFLKMCCKDVAQDSTAGLTLANISHSG